MSPFVSSKYFNNYCYTYCHYTYITLIYFDDLWCSWIYDLCLNCLTFAICYRVPFQSRPMRYHEIPWVEDCRMVIWRDAWFWPWSRCAPQLTLVIFGDFRLHSRRRWNFDVSEVKPWFRKSPSMCRKWNSPKWQNCHVEMLSARSDIFQHVLIWRSYV